MVLPSAEKIFAEYGEDTIHSYQQCRSLNDMIFMLTDATPPAKIILFSYIISNYGKRQGIPGLSNPGGSVHASLDGSMERSDMSS